MFISNDCLKLFQVHRKVHSHAIKEWEKIMVAFSKLVSLTWKL